MAESYGMDGTARAPRGDLARAVARIDLAVRQDHRQADRQRWVGEVRSALAEAQPLLDQLAGSAPLDAQALSDARAEIAAALAEADAIGQRIGQQRVTLAGRLDGMAGIAIPLPPGAGADQVAAAQALARLIAANARPALTGQARLRADAVMAVIAPAEK